MNNVLIFALDVVSSVEELNFIKDNTSANIMGGLSSCLRDIKV